MRHGFRQGYPAGKARRDEVMGSAGFDKRFDEVRAL
jgi:hypothetical protein